MPRHNQALRNLYSGQWRHLDGVVECGYEFGGQREFSGAAPLAPENGVRAKFADPSQKQIDAANGSFGYDTTDQIIILFAETLDCSFAWDPKPDDRIIVLDQDSREPLERWMVMSVQPALWGSQWVCHCRMSPLTRNPANAAPVAD